MASGYFYFYTSYITTMIFSNIIICLEKKKQKLKEYQKNYREANKSRKSAKSRNLIKNALLYPLQTSTFDDLFSYLYTWSYLNNLTSEIF